MAAYEDQKQQKPSIDEIIKRMPQGQRREDAEAFVAFLREHKMSPQWGALNSYNISYKARRVCIIKLSADGFELRLNTQYNAAFNDCLADEPETIQQFLRDNIPHCTGCGTCMPGITMDILGMPMANACHQPVIRLENPTDAWLALARKLVMLRRQMIAEGKAPRVTYISVKKREGTHEASSTCNT